MQLWQGRGSTKLPNGESLAELQQRAWKAVESLLAQHKDGTPVVVSHYFVTLVIILKALNLPLDYFTKFKIDPGGVSMLEIEDYGPRLVVFNDTSY